METKHEKVVKFTRRIVLLSLGLMFVVNYFDKRNYSDESVIAVIALLITATFSVLYRWNFEIKNGLFDLKKNLPVLFFLAMTVLIFIFFYFLPDL